MTTTQDKKLQYGELFKAEFLAPDTDDASGRMLTFSFASPYPVRRWYGALTLETTPESVMANRVALNAVPFLVDHNSYDKDSQMGMVRSVWVQNGIAYCRVEFNDDEEALDIRSKMLSGMRPNVSPLAVPLSEDDIEVVEEDRKNYFSHLKYKRWEPYEISSVSIPANPEVGIGAGKLSATSEALSSKIEAMNDVARRRYWDMTTLKDTETPNGSEPNPTGKSGGVTLSDEQFEKLLEKANKSSEPDPAVAARLAELEAKQKASDELAAQQAASLEVWKIAQEHAAQIPGALAAAAEHLSEGGDPTSYREKLITLRYNSTSRQSLPQGEDKEHFMFERLCRAKCYPDNKEALAAAEYELNVGAALTLKAQHSGIMVPFSDYSKLYMLGDGLGPRVRHITNREERLAVTTAAPSGGSVVPTFWDYDRTVDFLFEDADLLPWCDVAMGLTGNVQVPIMTHGAEGRTTGAAESPSSTAIGGISMQAEGAEPAQGLPVFSHYSASPNMLSVTVIFSKQLLTQTNGWAEMEIRKLLSRQFRSVINRLLLNGTGHANNEPNGLLSTTGLPMHKVTGGLSALGWGDAVDFSEMVDNEWVPMSGRGWAIGKEIYGQWLKKEKAVNSGRFVLEEEGDRFTRRLLSFPTIKTSHIAKGADVGGKTVDGRLIHGNFMDMFVGFWDGFEVVIDGITSPANVKLTVMVMWDAICARKESFVLGISHQA